jgi:putative tricarboxylic transport membrane protein
MTLIDYTLLIIAATMLGAIVGLLPGFNALVGLIMAMPFIGYAPVWSILIFWTCYLTVTQYYGSVSALLFKVPGETSSIPVLLASSTIARTRGIIKSIRVTAFSSLIAGLVGIVGFGMFILFLKNSWAVLFRTEISIIFLLILTVLLLFRQKNYFINAVLILTGVFIANLGDITWLNQLCGQQSWTCFSLKPTDIGVAIICLYALPYLFLDQDHFNSRILQPTKNIGWGSTLKFWPVAARHGILGWVLGFIPGMGATISSNTSAALETGRKPRRLRVMAAAEASNNSSIISCTVPFLFMGLPITSTELFLDNWLSVNKAVNVNATILYETVTVTGLGAWPMWSFMLMTLTVISLVCFILTTRFIGLYSQLSRLPSHVVGWTIRCLILFFLFISVQSSDLAATSTIFTLVFFTLIGVWSQRSGHDIIALPVSLVVGSFAVGKFLLAFQLWRIL